MNSPVKRRIFQVILAMLGLASLVLTFIASDKNATIVRNSLVSEPLNSKAFTWHPSNAPDDFLMERKAPPPWFTAEFSSLNAGYDELDTVNRAIDLMHQRAFVGKPIQSDLKKTWRLISEKGRGYCADYSKLFTAMMLTVDIPVREWALGHEDFGSGHTFNEVYIDGSWVFVDAFNGMMIRDKTSGELLSVLEYRGRLEARNFESVTVVKRTDPDSFFQTREEGLEYYARSTDFFYLIWGNNVFSYEASPWVQWAAGIARPVERLVAIVTGDFPQIRMLETQSNGGAISWVKTLKQLLYLSLVLEVLLAMYLLWLIRASYRSA